MKKLILISLFSIATAISHNAFSRNNASEQGFSNTNQLVLSSSQVNEMSQRVKAIRRMDKRHLSLAQKAELKNELTTMQSKVSKSGPIFYFTLGALVAAIAIIILLL